MPSDPTTRGPRRVRGTVAYGYEAVREEFAAYAAGERDDYDAQLVAYLDGRQVVDLWTGPDFTGDSLVGVYSSTKGAAHLTVALLVQDGTLDLDERVSHYWPEFGAEGKQDVTLRDLLAHRAGVVGADAGFSLRELADDRAIAERLAAQCPYWRPGAAFGYHALVIGALTGEVVRRVTGQSLQAVYESRIRAPYGIDFYLGLPEEHESRVLDIQPMLPTPEQQGEMDASASGPHTLVGIAYNRNHPQPTDMLTLPNSRAVRAGGPASFGGVASARGLARLYAVAISGVGGEAPLLKPNTVAEFTQIHSAGYDLVSREYKAYGLGFSASADRYPLLSRSAFGHSGAGGSQAFADPHSGLAYGYSRRRYAFPGGAAPENDRFVRAVHRAAVGS
ncbi:serine hydrolase domain-containing protein [Streptomyces sp. CA-106131]|uniref:serine hydrolase domain-containing protein n=1 Tax=Streptomyces sp. CA-106131 TaxID=3240045 RepID=UPI003D941378